MTDLRSAPREPFGPRQPGLWGGLLRAAQWGLTIIMVICMWPAVMLVLTALLEVLPKGGSWRMPPISSLLIYAAWCLWCAMLVLTGIRVSRGWHRWWVFYPIAAAYGALIPQVFLDASDPVGWCIVQLMAGVAAAQCLLHGLWSLSAWLLRRKGD